MADEAEKRTMRIEALVERSRFWVAEDMLRNLEEEMRRMEEGMSHMIWDSEMRRVTQCPSPLPVIPRFEAEETDVELKVRVSLPGVPSENISVSLSPDRLEIFARLEERVCRPFFLAIDTKSPLDTKTASSRLEEGSLEVTVRKLKKIRVRVQ